MIHRVAQGLVFTLALMVSNVALAADQNVVIFAAASTVDALDAARAAFAADHPQVTTRVSYGASSTLAKQIAASAEADLFLAASDDWADYLEKRQLASRRRDLLGNRLVVVVPHDSQAKIDDLADLVGAEFARIALADPQSVPAGIYARGALTKAGVWEKVRHKVAGAADVRQATRFVETKAADAGIVYSSDARASKQLKTALAIDSRLSGPIRYSLVLLPHRLKNPAAQQFYDYLGSKAAAEVFEKHGFEPLPAEPHKPAKQSK